MLQSGHELKDEGTRVELKFRQLCSLITGE